MGFWMTVFAVWVGVIFSFLSIGLLFVVFLFSTSREEKEERQSGGGVDSRPLASPGKAHEQAAQAQWHQRLPQGLAEEAHLHIPDHKQVHHHDEKHDITIDGSDARLRKVHGIQRQQRHGNAG